MSTKIFRSGNSLAVRLPKGLAFEEGTEVEIRRDGANLIVSPARLDMASIVARLAAMPPVGKFERLDMKAPKRLWDGE